MDFEEDDKRGEFEYRGPGIDLSHIMLQPDLNKFVPTERSKPNYIHVEGISGRDFWSRTTYDCGISWGLGIFLGGSYGVLQGFQSSPSSQMKVRLNSVLNASGRGGSRLGNALGVLSLMYNISEWSVDKVERNLVGEFPHEIVNPILAGAMMGGVYKFTKGPKTAALAAVIGGTAAASYRIAGNYVPSMFPQLSFLF